MRREWSHNTEYQPEILSIMPHSCIKALDVGCGEGLLARQLTACCGDVTGSDLDSQIIAAANNAEPRLPNITFKGGDIMTYPFQPCSFTFLSSVATLHHLPLEPSLMRFRELLAPGGTLVIIGRYRAQSITDVAWNAAGFIASQVKRRFHRLQRMHAPMMEPQQTYGRSRRQLSVCYLAAM